MRNFIDSSITGTAMMKNTMPVTAWPAPSLQHSCNERCCDTQEKQQCHEVERLQVVLIPLIEIPEPEKAGCRCDQQDEPDVHRVCIGKKSKNLSENIPKTGNYV